MTVYLDPQLNTNEYNIAINAINYWNQWATSAGMPAFITISYANPFAASVVIVPDPGLSADPATGAYFNNETFNIGINPLYGNRTDGFLQQCMTHELGHAIGLRDVYTSGCSANDTIMFGNINAGQGPYYSLPTATDFCELSYTQQMSNAGLVPKPGNPDPINVDGWWCPNGECDPLVLDLSGKGVQTSGVDDPVWFDVDGDGKKEHLAWTSSTALEGFLWINLTGKNRVDNGTELFGTGTVMPDGVRPHDGFEALAIYDRPEYGGNGDSVIDASDGVWEHLRIWIDANHNGTCDPGETRAIGAFGIVAIPLNSALTLNRDTNGNIHQRQGLYYRMEHGTKKAYEIDSLIFRLAP